MKSAWGPAALGVCLAMCVVHVSLANAAPTVKATAFNCNASVPPSSILLSPSGEQLVVSLNGHESVVDATTLQVIHMNKNSSVGSHFVIESDTTGWFVFGFGSILNPAGEALYKVQSVDVGLPLHGITTRLLRWCGYAGGHGNVHIVLFYPVCCGCVLVVDAPCGH